MEERKDKILRDYFPEPNKDRQQMENLFDMYIKRLDYFIKQARVGEKDDHPFPFVVIGCQVEIEDMEMSTTHTFRIVNPFTGNVSDGDLTYVSPVGRSLLFLKVGDEVTVEAPGGVFGYRVKDIKFL